MDIKGAATQETVLENNLLSIEEVAKYFNTSIKIVRREIASGFLFSKKHNNRYLIPASAISNIEFLPSTYYDTINILNKKRDRVNWIDISKEMQNCDGWKNKNDLSKFNFIDLFSGAGGLSCGLKMAGLKPLYSVEIMEQAVATYNRNFSEKIKPCNIRDEKVKQDLYDSIKGKHIHLIAGGPPCQGFSMAGHRIVNDSRNTLYLEMLKIVDKVKPDFVLMENVEGLRSILNGAVEKKIIEDYKNIGYEVNVTTLNSADYGVPQMRKRVIFIGNRIGKVNLHPKPIYSTDKYKTVKDGIERFMSLSEDKTINHIFARHTDEMIERLQKLPEGQSLYGNYSDAWKKVFWDKPSPTIKENHGGVNVHPKFPRCMTPRELAALQSFPDDFIFEGSKKWQLVQIGNAVPPILGKAIGLAIKNALIGVDGTKIYKQPEPDDTQLTLFNYMEEENE
jgi:DNA (cytosine-5)-methyltransferase 1